MAEVAGKKFKRQSIVAAQCRKAVLAPFGYSGTCDAKLFNFWLEKMLVPCLKTGQTVVMDNASIHKTAATQSIIEKAGCNLLFLPLYSPDLNPIEHLWANSKRKLKDILPKYDCLQDALCACFSWEKDYICDVSSAHSTAVKSDYFILDIGDVHLVLSYNLWFKLAQSISRNN